MHPYTLTSQGHLALVYLAQGRRGDADPLLRGLLDKAHRQQERLPPFTLWMIGDVGDALLGQRDFVEAEPFLRFYLDVAAKKLPDGWRRPAALCALGACLLGQKKHAEARSGWFSFMRNGTSRMKQPSGGRSWRRPRPPPNPRPARDDGPWIGYTGLR
jgi:hypothetical protein